MLEVLGTSGQPRIFSGAVEQADRPAPLTARRIDPHKPTACVTNPPQNGPINLQPPPLPLDLFLPGAHQFGG